MDSMKHRRLQEMDRSDFGIVDGEPDIRGWDVKISSGQKVGEVEDLIVDAQKKKVRYMVVDRSSNDLDLKEYKVLIPIGLARLDQNDDDVMLPGITVEQLRDLPGYDVDNLDEKTERMICTALGRKETTTATHNRSTTPEAKGSSSRTMDNNEDEFYRHDYFSDDNLYKNRMHEAQPASSDSDYRRGLQLWELRSEGTVIPNDQTRTGSRDLSDERRSEMIRDRRRSYEDRRGYHSDRDRGDMRNINRDRDQDRHHRQDNSISARIDREGLRDAGH